MEELCSKNRTIKCFTSIIKEISMEHVIIKNIYIFEKEYQGNEHPQIEDIIKNGKVNGVSATDYKKKGKGL